MARLQTAFTERLGVRVPVLNAPMTPHAGGALARAVSASGAFGMFGFDEDESAGDIRAQLALLALPSPLPFGIGLVAWVLEKRPELLELALEARPALVSISFGDPAPYVERLHAAGILVGAQVQNRASAQSALDAGVDILVAQGTEAGGHTGSVGTLPLLQLVLEMTDRPVIAAGGIVTGRGLAAVLAAGAAGAWIGTPFLVASESRTPARAQARIIASDETQTIYTSVYDRAQRKGWTSEFRGRAIRNAFAEEWNGREDELMQTPSALTAYGEARKAGDYSRAHIYAGQSIGAVNGIRPAAEIVTELETGAIAALERAVALRLA